MNHAFEQKDNRWINPYYFNEMMVGIGVYTSMGIALFSKDQVIQMIASTVFSAMTQRVIANLVKTYHYVDPFVYQEAYLDIDNPPLNSKFPKVNAFLSALMKTWKVSIVCGAILGFVAIIPIKIFTSPIDVKKLIPLQVFWLSLTSLIAYFEASKMSFPSEKKNLKIREKIKIKKEQFERYDFCERAGLKVVTLVLGFTMILSRSRFI